MQAPSWLTAQLLVSMAMLLIMVHVVLIGVAYAVYLERKISAYIQDRIGPNRVGFDFGLPALAGLKGMLGLGQPLADGIKFMLKEDFTPNKVDKVLFTLAPAIVVVPALIGFIVIPWGGMVDVPTFTIPLINMVIDGGPVHVTGANLSVGIVYLLAVAALGVYGVTLGGWASNNKFSFLGGLRATAQMISYEIPMGMALLAVLLIVGTFMPEGIIRYQANHGWLLISQPLAAAIFYISALAEANRAPFDNAEAEQELVGGYHTEYSSMRFALYFLAEYAHLITSSAFFVLLFMGGYSLRFLPFIPDLPGLSPDDLMWWAPLVKFAVFFGKVTLMVCFAMVVRWTIPRLRYDQVMMSGWQLVIPLALALVVTISCLVYFDLTGILPSIAANIGLVLLLLLVAPLLPKSVGNRKIPMFGSRFNPTSGERIITSPQDSAAIADHPLAG